MIDRKRITQWTALIGPMGDVCPEPATIGTEPQHLGRNASAVPAAFGGAWDAWALAYYAADEVGVAKRSHAAVFKALHEDGSLPMQNVSADELASFYTAYGVSADRYKQALRGDAVQKKVAEARAFAQRTQVPGTPAIIINGQYLVRGNSFDDQLRIASKLISEARARGR